MFAEFREHFDDGPFIPGHVADAYNYFGNLCSSYPKQVEVFLFQRYPTYSFYQFDDQIIVALYPTTTLRIGVPTLRLNVHSRVGNFFRRDYAVLSRNSTPAHAEELKHLANAVIRTG